MMNTTEAATGTTDGADGGRPQGARLRIAPVVLAGGAGTRLWPLSREHYPKQLIDLIGPDSLLQATLRRMEGFSGVAGGREVVPQPIVACGEEHRFITAEQLRASGIQARLMVEPARRNTAPALTIAAWLAQAQGEDQILVVMPADHAILDAEAFQRALAVAADHAERGAMVTLGVPPTRPETGYGYIRLGAPLADGAHEIARFVEKPALELAAQYVQNGQYWWNSGIFVVRANVWLQALQALQPEMYESCMAAVINGRQDAAFFRPAAQDFLGCPSDSIDYAVMERLESPLSPCRGVVVPLAAGWSDLGSWDAVWDATQKDTAGNAARGRVVFEGATHSYAHSDGRLVACVGTSNIVVIETADAVLVVDRSHVQDVKGLVERIKADHAPEAEAHRKVRRPWGFYDSIDHGPRFQVKRIVVEPGASLSLQLHHHRAEHWVVVSGTALVQRGDEKLLLGENQSTYIPLGVVHRLENPGKLPLEIIEIQSGGYLGEDDIVRLEDSFGRCENGG